MGFFSLKDFKFHFDGETYNVSAVGEVNQYGIASIEEVEKVETARGFCIDGEWVPEDAFYGEQACARLQKAKYDFLISIYEKIKCGEITLNEQ